MRLGRIAAALTSASSMRKAYGLEVHVFRRLVGSLLVAACLLLRLRQLRACAARQAVLLRGWQQAAAVLQQQYPLAVPRFAAVYKPSAGPVVMLPA